MLTDRLLNLAKNKTEMKESIADEKNHANTMGFATDEEEKMWMEQVQRECKRDSNQRI